MALNSGERQVTPNISEIRRDHVARYEWALTQIPKGGKVIDFACGIGYGCRIIADAGALAHGFDIDAESIEYAKENYSVDGKTKFTVASGDTPPELGEYDVAISFETIEHIEDPRPLLKALREAAPVLLASVPNEDVMPWMQAPGIGTAFHFRHYTKLEFAELLAECGWKITDCFGQEGKESEVEAGVDGRTLIAVCERCEIPVEVERSKHIAILGLGPSVDQFTDIVKRVGGRSRFCDEVWAINALGNVFDCDLIFHMDDIRIQEIRAAAKPASNIAAMVEWIKRSKTPVMTSRAHPKYPALIEFPLEDVLNTFGQEYFNSTAAYAVCFAIYVGATQISVFGMDFTYANQHDAEKGRACVEWWLGVASQLGVELSMPRTTSLMDAYHEQADRFYGYDTVKLEFAKSDSGVELTKTFLDTLPDAETIEQRYDHSAPIETQHVRSNTE